MSDDRTFYLFTDPDTGDGFTLTWEDGEPCVTSDDDAAEDRACGWQQELLGYQLAGDVTDLHSAFRKLKSLGADTFARHELYQKGLNVSAFTSSDMPYEYEVTNYDGRGNAVIAQTRVRTREDAARIASHTPHSAIVALDYNGWVLWTQVYSPKHPVGEVNR